MSNDNREDDYEVGYGKPPKNTQFQKGVSGNPRGRPKKARDFDSQLLQESESLMTINENGRPRRISKHGIVIKQLMKLAMTGNILAARTYLGFYQQTLTKAAPLAGTQPSASGKYKAEDLTDDQLTEIIMTGGLKKT